jgi:hypothetical protein
VRNSRLALGLPPGRDGLELAGRLGLRFGKLVVGRWSSLLQRLSVVVPVDGVVVVFRGLLAIGRNGLRRNGVGRNGFGPRPLHPLLRRTQRRLSLNFRVRGGF